jgi:hypothetical protein
MLRLFLGAFAGLTSVAIAAFGAGAWISRVLPESFRRFERAAFVLLGGLGILSTLLFLVGQLSFTRSSISLIVIPLCAVGLFIVFRAFSRADTVSPARSRLPVVPVALVLFILSLTALCGLAEITGDWGNDAVAYHLLGPKVWLRNGVILPVADNCHTAFPPIPETLFAALWSMGGARTPGFSSFLTFALLLAAAASLAIRVGLSSAEAWWVAALVGTMPAVYNGSHSCFVDGMFAAFVIAACRIGLDAKRLREWVAFGLFCGFAIGTKYIGLLAVPAIILCILVVNREEFRKEFLRGAGGIALAIAVAFLTASPYYIRNWLQLGCPIYPPPPGYPAFCSPRYFSAEAISEFHAYIRHRGAGLGRGLRAFLLLPFNLTYHTSNFHGAGGIGLCPLALGPIGILAFRSKPVTRVLALSMFLLLFLWFLTQQESRFLIHVYVISTVFAVLGWREVVASQRRFSKYLVVLVVLLSCSYGIFMIVKARIDDARTVLSPRFAAVKRETSIPYLASFNYLNRESSVQRVLILDNSVPPLYLDKDYLKPIGQWGERTLPGAPDSHQALAQALAHQLGVSHVLDVHSVYSAFQIKPGSPELLLVFETPDQRVYRLN